MYKFEKMFRDNDVKENDPELPRAIAGKIEKFRAIQAEITAHPDDKEGNQKRKAQLDDLDEQIMKTLPDFFEIEDEEETIKQQNKQKMQEKLDKRAAAVGLPAGSDEATIVKAEKATKEKADNDEKARKALDKRAMAVGLAAGASETDINTAEKAAKKKQDDEENAPAASNAGALEKLYKKGKTTVTKEELKAAGFDTGFWGPIGPNGCTKGGYRLYRDDPNETKFVLSKVG